LTSVDLAGGSIASSGDSSLGVGVDRRTSTETLTSGISIGAEGSSGTVGGGLTSEGVGVKASTNGSGGTSSI